MLITVPHEEGRARAPERTAQVGASVRSSAASCDVRPVAGSVRAWAPTPDGWRHQSVRPGAARPEVQPAGPADGPPASRRPGRRPANAEGRGPRRTSEVPGLRPMTIPRAPPSPFLGMSHGWRDGDADRRSGTRVHGLTLSGLFEQQGIGCSAGPHASKPDPASL